MAPGQSPQSARWARSCPRTIWKWTALRRASSLRSQVPSQPPWRAPSQQMAGPRPPRPRNAPRRRPPRRRKAPRTSRPWRGATSAASGDPTHVASALCGQSPKGLTRGPPPTLVLRLSPLGRIGPKPSRTPWLVRPRTPGRRCGPGPPPTGARDHGLLRDRGEGGAPASNPRLGHPPRLVAPCHGVCVCLVCPTPAPSGAPGHPGFGVGVPVPGACPA